MNLKQLRESRGWNQQTAASVAGISQGMWSEIESGTRTPSVAVVEKIAEATGTQRRYVRKAAQSSADQASSKADEIAEAILARSPAELEELADKAAPSAARILRRVAALKSDRDEPDPWADPNRDALGRHKSASVGAVRRDALGRSRKDASGNVKREEAPAK